MFIKFGAVLQEQTVIVDDDVHWSPPSCDRVLNSPTRRSWQSGNAFRWLHPHRPCFKVSVMVTPRPGGWNKERCRGMGWSVTHWSELGPVQGGKKAFVRLQTKNVKWRCHRSNHAFPFYRKFSATFHLAWKCSIYSEACDPTQMLRLCWVWGSAS